MSIADMRREYTRHGLDEADVHPDPVEQFRRWFGQAVAAGVPDPNAMTLATAGPDGRPSARVVLLKAFDARGFVFFTNYHSRKGRELTANPAAAVLFFWSELERQVRVEGAVRLTTAEESDEYFRARPLESRLAAWASPQSEPVASRGDLERRMAERRHQYPGEEVPRPPYWGGYRLAPDAFEFWQGRPSRLHDRIGYFRMGEKWATRRLAP
jgi:pyridoxamine 5'-phosphate oxidase